MNKAVCAVLITALLLSIVACTPKSSISAMKDIKSDAFLGKTVTVEGKVLNNVKIGSISGYRLEDATDSMAISAQILPAINSTVTVTGVVQKSPVFGYYIAAEEK